MNLFERIKSWLRTAFVSDKAEQLDKNPSAIKHEVIMEFDRHLQEIKRAMVHLVYERKNLEQTLIDVKGQKSLLDEDLKNCLYENKDQLAAEVLAQIDQANSEEEFYSAQLTNIKIEIEKAKEADGEMQKQMSQAKHQLNLLIGKQKLLKVRKQLMSRLDRTTSMVEKKWPTLQQISEKVKELEAETEVEQFSQPKWQSDLKKMRDNRKQSQYSVRVKVLKNNLFSNSLVSPSEHVYDPEVIEVGRT